MKKITDYLNVMNENGWISYSDYSILFDMAKELENENISLRKRLKKAIELPCKEGETVYLIVNNCLECQYWEQRENQTIPIRTYCSDIGFYNFPLYTDRFLCKNGVYCIIEQKFKLEEYVSSSSELDIKNYNKTWFTNKRKAQRALKKMQEKDKKQKRKL